jgi:chemosensory pili system protein ChpA (sensor histidine kinase/response regulator)
MTENIDSSILLGFVDEARSYLPTIRQGITRYQSDTRLFDEIELAHRQIHTICGAAMMVGLEELGKFANVVEDVLENFAENRTALPAEVAASLFAQIDRIEISLETLADELNAGEASDSFSFSPSSNNFNDFGSSLDYANNFANNYAASENGNDFAITTAEFDDSSEIDPELLEVFAMEADDHLQNIGSHLAILEKQPQNKDALSEVRRSSHTLKGAAGVVGFKTITKLAHRMEDLLDHLAENPESSSAETISLLLSTTDVLEALSRGGSEQSLHLELETAYTRFDTILASLSVKPTRAMTEPAQVVAIEENQIVEATVAETALESSKEEQTIVHAIAKEEPKVLTENNNQSQTTVTPRPTVRVSVENLDALVNLVSELIINRTIMEQKVSALESQLNELHLNTHRLRRLANKLDADYEAGTLNISPAVKFNLPSSFNFAPSGVLALNSSVISGVTAEKYGFDSLEFDRYNEFHQTTRELLETSSDAAAVSSDMEQLVGEIDPVLTRQRRLTDEVQEKLLRVRMVPIGTLIPRLQRTVRVLAEQEGKLADFSLEGEGVEFDTQVLDAIAEPLLHLLRNAVGHGIEPPEERFQNGKPSRGAIRMKVYHEGTFVVINISDDGRGIDPHRLRERAVKNGFISMQEAASISDEETFSLIFLPGLSTAKEVTDISGRGVGMDIVREVISRQQGTISLKSLPEKGTTFTIRLPMSMAVTRALIVKSGDQSFAVPLAVISRVINATQDDFDLMSSEKVMWIGGKFYPVFVLSDLLHMPPSVDFENTRIPALVLNSGDSPMALVVDQVIEATEVVLKTFNHPLKNLRGYLGATILGNGDVVPILDIISLLNRHTSKTLTANKQNIVPVATPTQPIQFIEQLSVMIVDDSPSVRRVMSNLITNAGWKAIAVKDGLEALETLQVTKPLPQIILTDVEMPRMDGYELLSSLKRQETFHDIPVVMITSRAAEKHRQKAMDLGASEYVTKPYQDSFLLETIRNLTKHTT